MMRSILALGLVLIAGTASAARTVDLVEGAREAALGYTTLPGGAAGTVIFRACESCDARSLQVSSETRYFVGARAVTLTDLRAEASRLRASGAEAALTVVSIYYDLETNRVTRIKLPGNGA